MLFPQPAALFPDGDADGKLFVKTVSEILLGGSGGGFFKKTPRHFFCLQASPVSLPPARGFSSFRMRVKVCF
ncbi:hypothetical protein DWY70_05480 [Bacteroides fragilis]|nr:hypothetical protein DWY70_05480 [Bacteroides fragilis]RHB22711.1 hypothetical protein DW891_10565 [Bacteroides fragilis]